MKFSLILIFVFYFSGSLFSETKNDFYIGEYVGDPVKSIELYKKYKKKKGSEVTEERQKKNALAATKKALIITDKEVIIRNSILEDHFSYKLLKETKDSVIFEINLSKSINVKSGEVSTDNRYRRSIKFTLIFFDDKKSSVAQKFGDEGVIWAYKRK